MNAVRKSFHAPWTPTDLDRLRKLIALELPMQFIAHKLHRPEEAVRAKAHRVAMADMMRFTAPPDNRWTVDFGLTK